jgi:hypothetical protein
MLKKVRTADPKKHYSTRLPESLIKEIKDQAAWEKQNVRFPRSEEEIVARSIMHGLRMERKQREKLVGAAV